MKKLQDHAESMLGGMVAVFAALNISTVCVGMFFASGVSNSFDMKSGTWYPAALLFCISGGMMGLFCAIITWYLFR